MRLGRARRRRQQQRERAALAGRARDADLAAEQPRDLAADVEAEARAAVLARRRAVGLLEGLEDQRELLVGDPDAGVGDREREDPVPARPARHDREPDLAVVGELHGVRQEVAQDLLEALLVGDDRGRQRRVAVDREAQALLLGERAERALHVVAQVDQRELAEVEVHLARLDLGQVEDVVDQREQVVAGRVDRLGELDLLLVEVAGRVLGQHPRQDQEAVERRPQLVAHVRQELGLVLRGQRELRGLLLEAAAGELDLRVLDLDVAVLLGEQDRLVLELVVGLAQLLGLLLELLRQRLRLRQQLLRAHVRLDRVDHDPDRVGELVEERLVDLGERPQRPELDHAEDLLLEHDRHDLDRRRRGLARGPRRP